jgi:3-isopropylmalate dehydratase small subunit
MARMQALTVSRVTTLRPNMASKCHPGALIVTARMMYTMGSSAEIAGAAITPSHLMWYGSVNAAALEKPLWNNMT